VEDAASNINQIRTVLTDISERKRIEEHLKAALIEKEVLLREIHHRVKNNMQVIISLLRLQMGKNTDDTVADAFQMTQNRILAMALVHEKLYQSRDLSRIDLGEYIQDLANELFVSHGTDMNKIRLRIKIKDFLFDVGKAIPCGLIVDELVSNCLKYAFPQEREGNISIELYTINQDEVELTVKDDGVGLPEDVDMYRTATIGLQIVKMLAEHQLGGKIELKREKGTRFCIRFKRTTYK